VQPIAKPIAYRCPACGWKGEVWDIALEQHRHLAKTMARIGDFSCAFDERQLCKQCCPKPIPGDTDLRHLEEDPGYRIEITHARRNVRRVIWLSSCDLQDLESTLIGRRDGRYLGPETVRRRDSRAVEPGLQKWWRDLRAEIDLALPDLGRDLGMAPRFLDFGKLEKTPIARPLHLLNPKSRAAIFQITGGVLTVDAKGQPSANHFPYHLACTPSVEAARRAFDSFEVPPRDRLVIEILAQPWAKKDQLRRFELWATVGSNKTYVGEVKLVHKP
jgi:hypothetical protein